MRKAVDYSVPALYQPTFKDKGLISSDERFDVEMARLAETEPASRWPCVH